MLNDPDMQPNATINRWIQGVLMFDFKLVHVPASKHQGPDALLHRPLGEGEEIVEESDDWLDEIALYLTADPIQQPLTINIEDMHTSYLAKDLPSVYLIYNSKLDESLKAICCFLVYLEAPSFKTIQESHQFVKRATKYYMENGRMFKCNYPGSPLKVIFNPETRQSIMLEAHEGYGHHGEQAVWETIRQRFYWPHMRKDVKHHVKSCHTCQIRSTKKMHIPITISTPATC